MTTIRQVRSWRNSSVGPESIGFVPTMGFLHDGHLELVRKARRDNDRVAVSVFVNPAQFDCDNDFSSYPRDVDRDRDLLAEAGCDLLFLPNAESIYPSGFQTWIEPGPVAARNEGAHRAGHFRGVATVVLKLLNIVRPQRAYFGQKDAQQLAVVKCLARDLDLAIEVVGVDTVRERDGLALSSRNVLLSGESRAVAPELYRALDLGRSTWAGGDVGDADHIRGVVTATLAATEAIRLEYVSLADPETFEELETATRGAVLSLAATLDTVRLIDNILLEE